MFVELISLGLGNENYRLSEPLCCMWFSINVLMYGQGEMVRCCRWQASATHDEDKSPQSNWTSPWYCGTKSVECCKNRRDFLERRKHWNIFRWINYKNEHWIVSKWKIWQQNIRWCSNNRTNRGNGEKVSILRNIVPKEGSRSCHRLRQQGRNVPFEKTTGRVGVFKGLYLCIYQ